MSCNCGIQSYCSLCKRWKFALLDKKNMSYLENKSKGSTIPLTHWYNGDDKPIKFHELYIEPKKPKPQKMVYLSVRIDGHTKTKINANIQFDNKQGEINE